MYLLHRTIFRISRTVIHSNLKSYCSAPKNKLKNEIKVANELTKSSIQAKQMKKFKEEATNDDDDERDENEHKENRETGERVTDIDFSMEGRFQRAEDKNRQTFLDMVNLFVGRDKHRRHHVEFVYAALKHMREYGVERDIEVYKAILDVMPKGKFIPTNMFQAEFMHYPKQQHCIIYFLDQMEHNG